MNKAIIEGKLVDILSEDQFFQSKKLFDDPDSSIAVEMQGPDGETYVLPYRQRNTTVDKNRPGIYNAGPINFMTFPTTEEQKKEFQPEVIDFNNITDIKDFDAKREQLANMEKQALTTTGKDNVFKPPFSENDTPEMRAMKEAVAEKNIDLDKYMDRFGAKNYPNTKRKLKDDNITLFLIKRCCECLDMKATLILEDKSPDVPNPIGRKIVAELTSGFDDGSEENDE